VRPIRTPMRAPKANAYCERLIGTLRRECLDYFIPINFVVTYCKPGWTATVRFTAQSYGL
jgi:hypothetical protein